MALKKIGDNTGDAGNSGNGSNSYHDKAANFAQEAAQRFGTTDDTTYQDLTVEEAFDKIKQSTPEGTSDALLIMVAAIETYNRMQRSPGDQTLLKKFYMHIEELTDFPKNVLRTIIASGIVSTATLKEQMKGDND